MVCVSFLLSFPSASVSDEFAPQRKRRKEKIFKEDGRANLVNEGGDIFSTKRCFNTVYKHIHSSRALFVCFSLLFYSSRSRLAVLSAALARFRLSSTRRNRSSTASFRSRSFMDLPAPFENFVAKS